MSESPQLSRSLTARRVKPFNSGRSASSRPSDWVFALRYEKLEVHVLHLSLIEYSTKSPVN